MRIPQMTTRGMMFAVAAVAAVFGAVMNAPWLIPLIIITSPQTIIVAVCGVPGGPGRAGSIRG